MASNCTSSLMNEVKSPRSWLPRAIHQTTTLRLSPSLPGRYAASCLVIRATFSKDLFAALWNQGTHLTTSIKQNMKNKPLPLMDITLMERSLIEAINDQPNNQEHIERTIHIQHSMINFVLNLFSGFIAYQLHPRNQA
jgi:hypothetical protein